MASRPLIGITASVEKDGYAVKKDYIYSIVKSGGMPLIMPPALNPHSYMESMDGLLIPGGDDLDPAYYNEKGLFEMKIVPKEKSDFEISLIHEIIKRGKPLLAICYGMQIVNVALGGTLYQDIEAQVPGAVNHRGGSHFINVGANIFFPEGRYRVGSTHHQAVNVLGRGLEPFAGSDDALVEAVQMKGHPFFLCVQWHPERASGDGISERIFELFIGACSGNK